MLPKIRMAFLPALLGWAFVAFTCAQESTTSKPSHVDVPTIAPHAEDVADIDGMMKAFYEVISGPPAQPRQWSRDRSLYIPEIRFVSMSLNKSGTRHLSPFVRHGIPDLSPADQGPC